MLTTIQSRASVNENEEMGYESMVNELSFAESRRKSTGSDPFDLVKIHMGFGLVTSAFTFKTPNGSSEFSAPRGFQASMGIDLFSPQWLAEGIVRSYSSSSGDKSTISLQEFDLRIAYVHLLQSNLFLRGGLGIAARYMDLRIQESIVSDENQESPITVNPPKRQYQSIEYNYTTPSSVAFVGVDSYLNDLLSVSGELSLRSAMIEETIDKQAVDLTVRLDFHF